MLTHKVNPLTKPLCKLVDMTRNDLASRAKKARIRAGFEKESDAAKAIGCSRPLVIRWESGEAKAIGKYLLPAARAYRVRPEWLSLESSDDGFPWGGAQTHPNATLIAPSATRADYVRYQDMGQGGAGPGVINPDYPEVFREIEIAEWQLRKELGRIPSPARVKLLTVRGNSMSPRIRHGDVVFVDTEDCQPEDGCMFAILLQGATLVKLLEFRRDGVHIVSLASPDRPDIVPPNEVESLRIQGRVLGAIQLRKMQDL